jgi:hypothetical protein
MVSGRGGKLTCGSHISKGKIDISQTSSLPQAVNGYFIRLGVYRQINTKEGCP